MVAILYVWLSAWAFTFIPWPAILIPLTGMAGSYAVVLAVQRGNAVPAHSWMYVTGGSIIIGYVIGQLLKDVERSAAAERDAREAVERVNADLEVASQHKSDFLANMSHELRTPLNAIIGFSEVLRERMFGELNERQDEYIGDILTSGQHLLALINDILDLSKVEAGRMELDLSEIDVLTAFESAVVMLRERAANHGITLVLDVPLDIGAITGDDRKLKQVVFNLFTNAVKFTAAGGTVTLSAHTEGDELIIAVTDTGVGIEPGDYDKIFEEFGQSSGSATIAHEGTGLGLPLSKRFVELHGGRMWFESQLGVGSVFSFAIPTRRRSATRVLHVDDDPLALKLVRAVLEAEGVTIDTVSAAEDCLAAARRDPPDLLIVDLMLRGTDGFALIDALRIDPATASIPIMVLTSKDLTSEDRARLGDDVHLAAKDDFNRSGFVELVRRCCATQAA
jgi:signal transduction histidine kinase